MELPPFRHDELPEGTRRSAREVDPRPVTGAMESYVGRQYQVADLLGTASSKMLDFSIFDDDCVPTPELVRSVARVRAFAVPGLEGHEVNAADDSVFGAALTSLLRQRLPEVPWLVNVEPTALRRYRFFEVSVAAPRDETTGMPMALQMFGQVVAIDGARRGTPAWDRLTETWRAGLLAAFEAQRQLEPLAVPFTARIEIATYANVQSCGVGVPFSS